MNLFRFLFSKAFYLNLLIAIILIVIAIFSTLSWLDSYTNHGESKSLRDFRGIHVDKLDQEFKQENLRYEIIDTVSDDSEERGVVIDQTPKAQSLVKDNRTIYLTINSLTEEKVVMPNLTQGSPKMAITRLKASGLVLDSIWYIPGSFDDLVVGQMFKGKDIEPGKKIKKGSKIVIQVSSTDLESDKVQIPNLVGLSFRTAKEKLELLGLKSGEKPVCDECLTADEFEKSIVTRQIPSYEEGKEVNIGIYFDIFSQPKNDSIQ